MSHLFKRHDVTKKEQCFTTSSRFEEDEDDSDTVVGIDYTDEEDEYNEDDYDSVPPNKNVCNTDSNDSSKDFQTPRYV